jgi:quercetin dioxygenase-like cupin family protein
VLRAYRLSTGTDANSHVEHGAIAVRQRLDVDTLEFRETAAHSNLDWHNAPIEQYVITLSGTLEFETKTGETFTLCPGDVLLALDVTGSGHKWRLIDDEPWKRGYVTIHDGIDRSFIPS